MIVLPHQGRRRNRPTTCSSSLTASIVKTNQVRHPYIIEITLMQRRERERERERESRKLSTWIKQTLLHQIVHPLVGGLYIPKWKWIQTRKIVTETNRCENICHVYLKVVLFRWDPIIIPFFLALFLSSVVYWSTTRSYSNANEWMNVTETVLWWSGAVKFERVKSGERERERDIDAS